MISSIGTTLGGRVEVAYDIDHAIPRSAELSVDNGEGMTAVTIGVLEARAIADALRLFVVTVEANESMNAAAAEKKDSTT